MIAAALFAASPPLVAHAQTAPSVGAFPASATSDSTLRLRALSPSGHPLAGVEIRLTALEDREDPAGPGLPRTCVTSSAGDCLLLAVEPGRYRAETGSSGTATHILGASYAASVDFAVGASESSEAVLRLQPMRPSLGNSTLSLQLVLNGSALASLPTRDGLRGELDLLAPLVSPGDFASDASENTEAAAEDARDTTASENGASTATDSAAEPTSAGVSPTQNATELDGLSAGQAFWSTPRGSGSRAASVAGAAINGATFGQGAIRSLRVMPQTFSARFGNGAGLLTAVASSRGGTQWHGAAEAQFRLSALAAVNPFSVVTHYAAGAITATLVKPQDNAEIFSARFGGPLWTAGRGWLHSPPPARSRNSNKTRALYALSTLEAQNRTGILESTPAVASFYALTATQNALLRNRGVSPSQTDSALSYLDSLSGPVQRSDLRLLASARLDATLSHRDALATTLTRNSFSAPAGASFNQASAAVTSRARNSVGDTTLQVAAAALHWSHAFSPRVLLLAHTQLVQDAEQSTPRAPLPQEPAISPGGYAPQITIAPNGFSYGTPAGLGRAAYPDEHRLEAATALQLVRATHLLSFGADWSRIHDLIAAQTNLNGSFLYDSAETSGRAGGLVDWITDYTYNVHALPNGGCPSINAATHLFCFRTFTQSFATSPLANRTTFTTHSFAAFAEDAFHPLASLSVTLGARYEYLLLPLPQTPNAALDQALRSSFGTNAVPASTASFPEDRNNIAPRLGLTWSPWAGRRGTLRLGLGSFFGRLPGATLRAALTETALPSTVLSVRFTPSSEVACPQVPLQGFGYPCAFPSTPPAAVQGTTSAILFATSFRLPALQRASVTWERDLTRHAFLRFGYAGALATQLPSSVDINIAPSTTTVAAVIQGGAGWPGLTSGQTFRVPLYTARRLTQYGPVTMLTSNANATFHAFTAELHAEPARSVQLQSTYTFSRAIDYGAQQGATPRQNSQFDPATNGYDKGLSSLNLPHRFTGLLLWRSHAPRHANDLASALLRDWRLAATATVSSGAPYTYEIYGGSRLTGGHASLNGSGGATFLPTVGRNTLRLPFRSNLDLRLDRAFALTGSLRLSAFAEAFNLLNQTNLSRVETRAFLVGTPASAGAPTPLLFQDAATVASESGATPAFGQPLSSTTGLSRERQLDLGFRLTF